MNKLPTIPNNGPQWPDVEKAACTLLNNILNQLDPPGTAHVVPPPDYEQRLDNGEAIITIQRTGGIADRTIDHPTIDLSVTTGQRSTSWDVMGWLRPQLHNFSGTVTNQDGTTAIITEITDSQGPRRAPDISRDNRRVTASFNISTRLER